MAQKKLVGIDEQSEKDITETGCKSSLSFSESSTAWCHDMARQNLNHYDEGCAEGTALPLCCPADLINESRWSIVIKD